ncbi:hypothetical protein [Nocardia altamirensis]|uniref:hypothetical protein n=1 Tax=Nocardia altamirensis TaxID=472158 RepID=UPI0008403A09|nr:hypothetical protein [Nocardia altamirensis]
MTTEGALTTRPSTSNELIPGLTIALAGLTALCNLWGAKVILELFGDRKPHVDSSLVLFAGLGALLAAVAIGYGVFLMSRRDEAGRYTVVIASGVLSVFGMAALVCALTGYHPDYAIDWYPAEGPVADPLLAVFTGLVGSVSALVHRAWIPSLTSLVLPLAVFLLASSRPTATWIAQPRWTSRRY